MNNAIVGYAALWAILFICAVCKLCISIVRYRRQEEERRERIAYLTGGKYDHKN